MTLPHSAPQAAESLPVVAERYKILIIASLRYPIREPFAGGLEAHTAALATGLRARGHSVLVAGATGSDPAIVGHEFGRLPPPATGERADTMENSGVRHAELTGFSGLMHDLRSGLLGSFDVIHNNSLYSLPVEQAHTLPAPMVTTLHTPPLPWSERVLTARVPAPGSFIAVSRATARSWEPLLFPDVVLNGIDTDLWPAGPGGPDAVWSGRIVREKAPHLAIDIARAAGLGLALAGPIVDTGYYAAEVAPRLDERIRYVGHLGGAELAALVGSSAIALVTPMWAEPFGMVVAEAASCGTPVVAFARGGIPEILDDFCGRLLTPPADTAFTPAELAAAVVAVQEAAGLDRVAVREHALRRISSTAMLQGYERVYDAAVREFDSRAD